MAEQDQAQNQNQTVFVMQPQSNAVTVPPVPGQQVAIQWMPIPATIPGCPPGLEYLTKLDQLLVHQQVELFEAFTGIDTKNRYQIKNVLGQQVYFAYEESDPLMRYCCESDRSFVMHIIDNNQQEVMRIVRPFQCCAGICWCADICSCCALTIAVESPPGQTIGHVRQRGSKWKVHIDILDTNMDPVLKIWGPCCEFGHAFCCTDDVDFKLMTNDESQELGVISKQWAGLSKEWFTNADNFGIKFPMDLDVKVKATLLGALFLIDFALFEDNQSNN